MHLFTTLLFWAAASLAPAQDSRARGELFVRPAPAPAAAGEVRVAIRVRIDPRWHLYHSELGQPDSVGKPTRVSFEGAAGEWSKVRFPEPKRIEQPELGEGGRDTWIWAHSGTILLYAAGRLAEGSDPAAVVAQLSGQTWEGAGVCLVYAERGSGKGAGPDTLFESSPADLRAPEAAAEPETVPALLTIPVEYVLRDEPQQEPEEGARTDPISQARHSRSFCGDSAERMLKMIRNQQAIFPTMKRVQKKNRLIPSALCNANRPSHVG